MSTIHLSASEACESRRAQTGLFARLVRRVADVRRERRRRQMLRQVLALHDGILDDLGVSRTELSLASRPRLPADVLAWIEWVR